MMMIMLVDVSKCIDDEDFLAIANNTCINNMFTKILYKVLEFQWIRFEL